MCGMMVMMLLVLLICGCFGMMGVLSWVLNVSGVLVMRDSEILC